MKKFFIHLAMLLCTISAFAQDGAYDEMEVRKKLWLSSKSVVGISIDATFTNASEDSLVTARTIKTFVLDQIAAYLGSGGFGSGVDTIYNSSDTTVHIVLDDGRIWDLPFEKALRGLTYAQLDSTASAIRADIPDVSNFITNSDAANTYATISALDDTAHNIRNDFPYVNTENLLVGGKVSWSGSGLMFNVTAANPYYINSLPYSSAAGSITLNAADATNPRIDVIALDNTGTIVKITGTPAANPATPQVDPATQFFLTTVYIAAGATTPTNISQTVVYNENTEFTSTATGVTVNFNNTSNVFNGSKSADVGTFANGNYFTFTNTTAISSSSFSTLKLYLSLKATLASTANIRVSFLNGSTTVTNVITLSSTYGFTKTGTGYQNITIPFSAFTFTNSFDKIRISLSGAGSGFYLDYFTLQTGLTSGGATFVASTFKRADSVFYKTGAGLEVFSHLDAGADSARNNSGVLELRKNGTFVPQFSLPTGVTVTFYGKNATRDSSILTLSDGTRFAAKDSVGSGGGSSVGIQASTFLGTLYNSNSWASTADFTTTGSTVTVTSNKLVFTGGTAKTISTTVGTSNTTLPNYTRITSYGGTMLERYKFVAKIKVNAIPSGTTGGFAIGTYGINTVSVANLFGYFNMTTGAGTGTVSILMGTSNHTLAISPTALTFSQNDYILLTLERYLDRVIITAENLTTGAQVSATYQMDFNSTNYLAPNTSNFAVANMGGTGNSFIVDSLNITSKELKNAPLMLVGDSKLAGYRIPFAYRVGSILNRSFIEGTITSSGQSDRTSDVLNHINEIISLAPRQVVLSIGRNDVNGGVSSATWQANIASIVSQLETAGIVVRLLDGLYETTTSQTSYQSYIASTYPSKYIPTLNATSYTAFQNDDAIHPTYIGHKQLAEIIATSKLIADSGKYINGKKPETTDVTASNINNYGTYYSRPLVYTPDVINPGDIVINAGAGITAAQYTASQKVRIDFQRELVYRSYIGSGALNAVTSHQFYTGGSATGGQVLGLTIFNGPFVGIGSAGLAYSTQQNDLALGFGKAIYGHSGTGIGNEGRIIPFSTSNHTEFRNYNTTGKHRFFVSSGVNGTQYEAFTIEPSGAFSIPATNTTTGTTGAQTINKAAGSVNFAAGAQTLVVTNSYATANSIIVVTVYGSDATAISARVTPAAGAFTITLNATATAETKVAFYLFN